MDALKYQHGGEHYVSHAIQPWHVIEEYGLNFWEGNCLKYLLRKKGNRLEDLKKAQHYLAYLIEKHEQTKTTEPTPGIIPGGVIRTSGKVIDIRSLDANQGGHPENSYSPCVNT